MEVWAGEVEKARAQRTHWLVALLAEAADCNIFFSRLVAADCLAGDVVLLAVIDTITLGQSSNPRGKVGRM
jgi:hypothetical protein